MSMTKAQLGIAAGLVAGAVFLLFREHGAVVSLRAERLTLRETAAQMEQLKLENGRLAELAEEAKRASRSPQPARSSSAETPRLRSQVEELKRAVTAAELARVNGPSLLQTLASKPEGWSSFRDQQKRLSQMFQGNLIDYVDLTAEQIEQFHDLQADHALATFANAIEMLRDGKSADEMRRTFAELHTALLAQVQLQFGADRARQFADYLQAIDSHIASQKFQTKMSGSEAERNAKSKQMFQVMRAVTLELLASRGLPPDHQVAPVYNPMNLVSPTEAEANLNLLAEIYDRLAERSAAFLSSDEIAQLRVFGKEVVDGNGRSLAISREMLLPGKQ